MKHTSIKIIITVVLLVSFFSCKKFVQVDPPKTDLITATVFESDDIAIAAISNIYAQMTTGSSYSNGFNGSSYLGGLLADELDLYNTLVTIKEFADNNLLSTNSTVNNSFWTAAYQHIYRANAILEGLSTSTKISAALKTQLEGESKFIRAFAHFYLVNLFGDVPLVVTTDYRVNAVIPRTSKVLVYQRIIADLKDAQQLLAVNYSFSKNERVRPNSFAATALLARVYLYTGDWVNAEAEASAVINNTGLYNLSAISGVFLKNSTSAIWQLSRDDGNTNDAVTFLITGTAPANAALKNELVNQFSATDLRKANWIDSLVRPTAKYYYSKKYKSTGINPITEYSMVLRLEEQYLIRAEARAQQGKIIGANSAATDLNVLRARAGIANTAANAQPDMLLAIEKERILELFTECGHRWLDLKRTNRADALLSTVKGPNWQSTDQLFPIPQREILNNPSFQNAQNPGY